MTDEVRDTLELVGITTIIESLNTEQEVLARFNINASIPQQ